LKKNLASLVSFTLISYMVFSSFFVSFCSASNYVSISVTSPVEGATYTDSTVRLKFTVTTDKYPVGASVLLSIATTYYVDGEYFGQLGDCGDINMDSLSNGVHQLFINAVATFGNSTNQINLPESASVTLNFTVDNGVAPNVDLVFYKLDKDTASFIIITDRPDSAIAYSLDGVQNFTVPNNKADFSIGQYQYNVTLTGLYNGLHNVRATATDGMDHCSASKVSFNITEGIPARALPGDSSSTRTFFGFPIQTLVVIATSVIVAMVTIGTLIMFINTKLGKKCSDK
jgi:hypothetical protein